MKLLFTNNHLHLNMQKSPKVQYLTDPDVWKRVLHNFKTATKKSGRNRNVVPSEKATNLMDCK